MNAKQLAAHETSIAKTVRESREMLGNRIMQFNGHSLTGAWSQSQVGQLLTKEEAEKRQAARRLASYGFNR